MKKHVLTVLLALGALPALAQDDGVEDRAGARPLSLQNCQRCGTVQSVGQQKRKGEGGAVGIVGGAVVGGLLGNQIGKGSGRAVATAGGAVAGGYVGNEIQKNANSRLVWVTQVRMKDGSTRSFEQANQPRWRAGQVVRVTNEGRLRM